MLDYGDVQLTARARALSLEVCTTGSIAMSVTGSGFVRATGSFLTDGFRRGMEVLGSGFTNATNNARFTITNVTATLLSVSGAAAEASASGKTLSVGLPQHVAWENTRFTPPAGTPWVEEQFVPGPTVQLSVGDGGTLEARPLYTLLVHVPEESGVGAANGYADGLIQHFRPLTRMTLTNGDTLRVRTDTGPFRGQMLRRQPGWAVVPVTFPLLLYTTNN